MLGGFIGRTHRRRTTTLGRGGSDYSASLVGAAIDAEEIQIWTDVDGMLTADPRIVDDAEVVTHLSFAEAAELAYFGAKVLHPSTIFPAVSRNIPVRILNSHRPEARGHAHHRGSAADDSRPFAALACKRGITVIDITSTRMLMAHGFLRRVFEAFETHETAVDVVTTSEVSVSVTIDDNRRGADIVAALLEIAEVTRRGADGDPDRRRRPAGDAIRRSRRAIVGALTGFPLRMVSQAASRRNVTIVLPRGVAGAGDDAPAPRAVRHRAWSLGERRRVDDAGCCSSGTAAWDSWSSRSRPEYGFRGRRRRRQPDSGGHETWPAADVAIDFSVAAAVPATVARLARARHARS